MRSPVLGTVQYSTFGQERSSVRRHRELRCPRDRNRRRSRSVGTTASRGQFIGTDGVCSAIGVIVVGSGLTQLHKLSPLDEVNARTDALVVDRIVRVDREVLLKLMLQAKMRSDPISRRIGV